MSIKASPSAQLGLASALIGATVFLVAPVVAILAAQLWASHVDAVVIPLWRLTATLNHESTERGKHGTGGAKNRNLN